MEGMGLGKKIVIGSILALCVFLASMFVFGAYQVSTPEGQQRIAEREEIERCESFYRGMADDPRETQQSRAFIYQACLNKRSDFKRKWNRDP